MKKLKRLVLGLAFTGRARGVTHRLANEKAAPNYKKMHAEAIGISPDASDDDAMAAHAKHMKAVSDALANDDDPAETMAAANERVTAPVVKKTEEEEQTTELPNERVTALEKKAAGVLLANAIREGRVLPADKGKWETKFTEDFDAAETELANAKEKVIKTDAKTKGLGQRQGEGHELANESARALKVQGLINEKMTKGSSYDAAFQSVRTENPALFESMQQPAAKK